MKASQKWNLLIPNSEGYENLFYNEILKNLRKR